MANAKIKCKVLKSFVHKMARKDVGQIVELTQAEINALNRPRKQFVAPTNVAKSVMESIKNSIRDKGKVFLKSTAKEETEKKMKAPAEKKIVTGDNKGLLNKLVNKTRTTSKDKSCDATKTEDDE